MWESPPPVTASLHPPHSPHAPERFIKMHGSSQPPYNGCLFVFQVNTTVISMAHESLYDGLCPPSAIISCPQISSHTIKIPNYSLTLSSSPQLSWYAFLFYSTELWPILPYKTQIQHSFQSFPDSSRQYYLPSALQPCTTPGVPLMWGLVFQIVRMSWYRLTWWARWWYPSYFSSLWDPVRQSILSVWVRDKIYIYLCIYVYIYLCIYICIYRYVSYWSVWNRKQMKPQGNS